MIVDIKSTATEVKSKICSTIQRAVGEIVFLNAFKSKFHKKPCRVLKRIARSFGVSSLFFKTDILKNIMPAKMHAYQSPLARLLAIP